MDDLPLSWYNLHDHDSHEEQSFNFDSESMFLNQIHIPPTNWQDQCINTGKEVKNVISISTNTPEESLECLLSGMNSSTNGSDANGISVLLSNCKTFWPNNNGAKPLPGNNNISGVSSGDSNGAISQCSSRKRPINSVVGGSLSDNPPKTKRSRSNTGSSNINFQQPGNPSETDMEAIAHMKEMIYREAAFRPVSFGAETVVDKPKRKNVRISSDPQTVAARQRRERISERIRILQKLVPGGNKMDTASMLDEAANYLKFLRSQVKALEQNSTTINANGTPPIISHASVVVPFTQDSISMQTHFQFPEEKSYPNPSPAMAE